MWGAYPVPALGPFPIASQGRNTEKISHSPPVAAVCQAAGAKPQQAWKESCPKMCLLQAERCQKISVMGIESLYYNFTTLRE